MFKYAKPIIGTVIVVSLFVAGIVTGSNRADALATAAQRERDAKQALIEAHTEKCRLIAAVGGECDDAEFGSQLTKELSAFPQR